MIHMVLDIITAEENKNVSGIYQRYTCNQDRSCGSRFRGEYTWNNEYVNYTVEFLHLNKAFLEHGLFGLCISRAFQGFKQEILKASNMGDTIGYLRKQYLVSNAMFDILMQLNGNC